MKRFNLYLYTAVVLLIAGCSPSNNNDTQADEQSDNQPFSEVSFYMQENSEGFSFTNAKLHAIVDGKDYQIEIKNTEDVLCLMLEATLDADNDGMQEALVRNVQACGGNAIGDCFFIVKYIGDGNFAVSDNMGSDASDIAIEQWNDRTSFVVDECLPNKCGIQKLRYIYENYQVQLVSDIIP